MNRCTLVLFALASLLASVNFAASQKRSGNRVIDILLIVDTDSVFRLFDNKTRATNSSNPLDINTNDAFMVGPRYAVVKGQASAELKVRALVGDVIRWFGVSESKNFDSAVIPYKIQHNSDALDETKMRMLRDAPCIQPTKGLDITGVTNRPCNHLVNSAMTLGAGRVSYDVHFALFKKSRDNNKQELYGYFKWDPTIVIPSVEEE